MPVAAPGWYDDPETGRPRYWDGRNWGPVAPPPPPSEPALPPPEPPEGRWSRVKIGAIGSLVVAPLLVYALGHSAAGAKACGSAWAEALDAVASRLCHDENLRVSDEQARDYIDSLFAHANGSHREGAVWSLMTHDRAEKADVDAAWHRVIRGERLTEVERAEGRNRFSVLVRVFLVPTGEIDRPTFYAAPLWVYQKRLTATLTRTGDGVRASSLSFAGNDPEGIEQPRSLAVVATSDFYDRPVREADAGSNLKADDTIWVICQLERPGQDDVWWSFTYLGWVPHADLETGDVEIPALRHCVYRPKP